MAPVSPRDGRGGAEAGDADPERGEVATGRKRRRIAQACEECRDRKRKCDGLRPVCGACSKRPGQMCVWNEERSNKGWTNNYVEGLRSRIRELEGALANTQPWAARGGSPSTQPGTSRSDSGGLPREWDASCLHSDGQAPSQPQTFSHSINTHQNISPQKKGVPMVACMPADPSGKTPSTQSMTLPEEEFALFDAATTISTTHDENVHTCDSDGGDTEIDAMGVIGSTTGDPVLRKRRPSEYFGPSSTFCLLDEACNVINQRLFGRGGASCIEHHGSDQDSLSTTSGPRSVSSISRDGKGSVYKHAVPPRAEADTLLESYWTSVHSLYPFIHRPSFQQRYVSLWSSQARRSHERDKPQNCLPKAIHNYYDDMGERLFHCLLNVVFALGALFNPEIPTADRDSVSCSFFDRAKAFLDFDLLACGSIALVQTLLLMGQYLQSTETPSSCWNMVGLAIRIAQGIGLHQEPKCCYRGPCTAKHNQLEVEMRRRTWTGCVLLDRVLSLTYGRPLMIRPTTIRNNFILPLPIDDEHLTRLPAGPAQQTPGTVSIIECYVEAVKLQDLLGQVLDTFYNRGPEDMAAGGYESRLDPTATSINQSRIRDSDLQMLLNVDGLLGEWNRKLPAHLKVQTYRGMETGSADAQNLGLFKRQATVLQARFLHVRLTLLRPALSALCDSAQQTESGASEDDLSSMRGGMMSRAANLCVKIAQELVDLITGNMTSRVDSLPAPWYNVFYIHSCAIVLLIGYLCSPRYITCMDESLLIANCKRCLAFFHAYESRCQSAGRCSKILELLEQQILRYRNGTAAARAQMVGLGDGQLGSSHIGAALQETSTGDDVFLQDNTTATPYIFSNDASIQESPDWMRETSDMTWLSLVPFFDNSLGNGF